jgi:hypothetical protein
MAKFDLIQIRRGKEEVVMTEALSKVNSRAATLRKSHRRGMNGDKVEFVIRPSESKDKFKKKPHNYNPSGDTQIPRVR